MLDLCALITLFGRWYLQSMEDEGKLLRVHVSVTKTETEEEEEIAGGGFEPPTSRL